MHNEKFDIKCRTDDKNRYCLQSTSKTMTEPDQSKFNFTTALKQTISQFFENTTLHGYKYLVDPKRDNFLER